MQLLEEDRRLIHRARREAQAYRKQNCRVTIPQDGVLDDDYDAAHGAYLIDPEGNSPIPELEYDGHEFGSSGGFNSNLLVKQGGECNSRGKSSAMS